MKSVLVNVVSEVIALIAQLNGIIKLILLHTDGELEKKYMGVVNSRSTSQPLHNL